MKSQSVIGLIFVCPEIILGGKHEQKRRTAGCTFAVYPQAKRAAVYRGNHGERVRRERTDNTERPLCIGSIRTDQAKAELQFAAPTKRKYYRLYGQPQAAIS